MFNIEQGIYKELILIVIKFMLIFRIEHEWIQVGTSVFAVLNYRTAGTRMLPTWSSFKVCKVTYVAGKKAECNRNSQEQTT
jgi:hypothetical protein